MTSDRTRVTYDPSRRYTGVIAQQGRVSLDADWNEAQAIGSEQLEVRTLDLIGPLASPDHGYRIDVKGETGNVRIRYGSVYLGGQRLVLSRDFCHGDHPDEEWMDWSRQRDTEWLDWAEDDLWRDARDDDEPHELIYLLAREHEVSAVEDHALRDVALGGPDTAQRLRILQRLIRRPTSAPTWEEAWGKLVEEEWIPRGFRPDPKTRRLEPAARLEVTDHPKGGAEEPVDQGGYLGPNNQLIRVQIAGKDKDGLPVLVWGFDNASFLYRLTRSEVGQAGPGSTTLRLATAPVDAYHQPAEHQAVEILRTAACLGGNDYIAASTGLVVEVTSAYNADSRELVVGTEVPAEYQLKPGDEPPLFLRVWQGFACGHEEEKEEAEEKKEKEYELGRTGIRVRLTGLEDGHAGFPMGAYWMIAVRPGVGPDSPTLVYPQRILDPQPPDGPRQWLAPVAFVRWHPRSPEAEDCIPRFGSLVRDEEHSGGSCTVRVTPEDVGGGWALQDVIDAHTGRERSTTICLEPGDYVLPKPLRIERRHGQLTIRATRPGVVLSAKADAAARFLLGLIIAREAEGLRLEGLEIRPGHANFVLEPKAYEHQPDRSKHMLDAHRHRTISIGLHVSRCVNLAVCDCRFEFSVPDSGDSDRDERQPERDLFAAGIFATEELRGVRVECCNFAARELSIHARSHPHRGEAVGGPHHVALGFVEVPTALAVGLDGSGDKATPGEPRGSVPVPLLDDAVFHDNLFEHLTAPVIAIGQLGTLRADRNTVRSCHAGFWLVNQHASHVLTFLDRLVNPLDDAYRDLVKHHLTALAEPFVFHTTVLARTLPWDLRADLDAAASPRPLQPPSTPEAEQAGQLLDRLAPPDIPERTPTSATQMREQQERMLGRLLRLGRVRSTRRQPAEVVAPPGAALPCCLDITGNTLHSGSAPALVILNTDTEGTASLILTGNQLRGYLRPGAVACLYLLRSCAASANVIVNGEADHDDTASLLILPRHHHDRHQAAITGNVLVGEAHLPDRPGGLPGWASLNSVTRS